MKRQPHLLIVLVALMAISLSPAVTCKAQEVAYSAICRNVIDRQPIGGGDSFEASVGQLWCFTKIVGAESPMEITHIWYFGDTIRARVDLAVRSISWRTYSSKKIQAYEIGDWHVDVVGPQGQILDRLSFKITPY